MELHVSILVSCVDCWTNQGVLFVSQTFNKSQLLHGCHHERTSVNCFTDVIMNEVLSDCHWSRLQQQQAHRLTNRSTNVNSKTKYFTIYSTNMKLQLYITVHTHRMFSGTVEVLADCRWSRRQQQQAHRLTNTSKIKFIGSQTANCAHEQNHTSLTYGLWYLNIVNDVIKSKVKTLRKYVHRKDITLQTPGQLPSDQPTNQPTTILTCAQKRTSSQLSLPHGTVN